MPCWATATWPRALPFQKLTHLNQGMLADYRGQRWADARTKIGEIRHCVTSFELAGFYDLYLNRIKEMEDAPPPANWDGVYVATRK